MAAFRTASVTVPAGKRCQDRVKVLEQSDRVVIIVADGAGGSSGGEQAAETVIQKVTETTKLHPDQAEWCSVLRQIDYGIGTGESTCVVAVLSEAGIAGASVGDSQAWFIADGKLIDLTKNQVRKPLLGSGEAVPTGFSHPSTQGLLLVSTDGFCNYIKRDVLMKEILWIDFAVLPRKLVEMVRLPSGDLWDDIGLVACRPRRRSER